MLLYIQFSGVATEAISATAFESLTLPSIDNPRYKNRCPATVGLHLICGEITKTPRPPASSLGVVTKFDNLAILKRQQGTAVHSYGNAFSPAKRRYSNRGDRMPLMLDENNFAVYHPSRRLGEIYAWRLFAEISDGLHKTLFPLAFESIMMLPMYIVGNKLFQGLNINSVVRFEKLVGLGQKLVVLHCGLIELF